jgi:hypothetical protein
MHQSRIKTLKVVARDGSSNSLDNGSVRLSEVLRSITCQRPIDIRRIVRNVLKFSVNDKISILFITLYSY